MGSNKSNLDLKGIEGKKGINHLQNFVSMKMLFMFQYFHNNFSGHNFKVLQG